MQHNRLAEYRAFIAGRATASEQGGFSPRAIPDAAKAHQMAVLDFALNRGKSAAFLDTGLGKSFIELEFARQCAEETGKPSLSPGSFQENLQQLAKDHPY